MYICLFPDFQRLTKKYFRIENYVGMDTRNPLKKYHLNHTLTRPENRRVCLFVIGIIQKINIYNI